MQQPRFDYGDEVRVIRTLRNDGTFPGMNTGAKLIQRGSVGFVRDVGRFLQDQIVYAVHFLEDNRVVGCREEELQPISEPWVPSRFETREKVSARLPLGRNGQVLVEPGEIGEIVKVIRDAPDGIVYHVDFQDRNRLQVPESALEEFRS